MDENPYKAPQEANRRRTQVERTDLERLGRCLVLVFAGVVLLAILVCLGVLAFILLHRTT